MRHIYDLIKPATSLLVAAAVLVSAAAVLPIQNVEATAEPARLVPDIKHGEITGIINSMIPQYHFRAKPLDDDLSSDILDVYIDTLDPNRSNFLLSDIETFDKFRRKIDDQLHNRNLDLAYQIFAVYQQRVAERASFALSLLESDFSFSSDESYRFNREDAAWATSTDELNEIWVRRVKNDYLSLLLSDQDSDEITTTLRKRYERMERRNTQILSDDVFQFFMNAYANAVEPHTAYFSPRTSENFRIRMSLSLEGIGAVLQLDNEFTKVRRIVAGGPADLSDALHSEDRIVGVAQGEDGEIDNVVGWRLDDVVDLIRGQKGTVVRLEILPKGVEPGGKTKRVNLVRDTIKLEEQAAKSEIIESESEGKSWRLGVITLPAFYSDFEARQRGDPDYRSTTRDVRKLIESLRKESVDGLVVDLRGNGGGSLTEATSLTGLFIRSGPVVQILGSNGQLQINRDPDPGITYTGPLAVLVDRNSASASEIFAGAIQDYRRGVIIGEPTFGKGTVQNLFNLGAQAQSNDNLGQLKVTVAQFFRINGESTQFRGVTPDVVLPTAIAGEYGERSLDHALPWATVKPARYIPAPESIFTRSVSFARQSYESRLQTDAGLSFLAAEAEVAVENQAINQITLNRDKRQALNDQRESDRLVRLNSYRIAVGLEPLESLDDDEDDDITDDPESSSEDDVVLQESAQIFADFVAGALAWPTNQIAVDSADGQSPKTGTQYQ